MLIYILLICYNNNKTQRFVIDVKRTVSENL